MTIDIRADVTCSLGTLISGSISDDYIQGNGLVKTKGQCELQGIHTPTAGTEVTFSYTRGGTTHQIPRRLRVLSSFADPFRNITKVELGCKLTYLQGVGPAPTVDGLSSETSGRQQQCLNGWTDYDANSLVPYPVSASALMDTCLARLSLTASSNPLTNRFFVDKFDFSQGYVPVLSDLLVSESYFGYLDENEVLQVRDLAVKGGRGPVLDANSIIDLDQVGVGDLPGDAVVVRYDALKLKNPIDTTDTAAQKRRDWEEEEILGEPESHVVRHTDTNGDVVENTYTYIPYQRTVTTYGQDESWDPTVCILSGREGADLSDSPIKAESTERILMAQAATNYCSELLSAGVSIDPAQVVEFKTKEIEYKYDGKGELVETIEYTFEPFYKWAGGLDLQFVYQTDTGSSHVLLGSGSVLVQKVITTRENVYAPTLSGTYIKAGEELVPVVEAQKVKTETYTNWALTQQGQQAVAQIKDQTPFTTAQQCLDWLTTNSTALVLSDGQVQINRGRDIVQGQKRAKSNERIGSENGDRPEVSGQLIYASGSSGGQRTISMSMPYQSDDYYTKTGAIVRGNAASKALRYGRSQNRLLMGNRYGVSIQVHPDRMPAHPYDPLYLSNGSLMVQYRANAANWAFSKDGVVASLDALFWGVAGGTGTSWAPVAPGITTFPPLPTVDADGNTGVDSVVPPWNETVPMTGVTRTTVDVQAYEYTLHQGETKLGTLVTRTSESILEVIGFENWVAVTKTVMDVTESGGPGPGGGLEIVVGDEAPLLGAAPVADASAFDDEWVILNPFDSDIDDGTLEIDVQGWLTIDSNNYGVGFISSNGVFTWPTSNGTTNVSPSAPALDKLPYIGGDRNLFACAYTLGNNYLRFRLENGGYYTRSAPDIVTEVTFFEPLPNGEQYIEVRFGNADFAAANTDDALVDLMICNTSTAYAQTTQQANTSYVLEGNATGTTWTIHENAHVSNPDGKFVVRLPDAVTRTKVTLAPTAATFVHVGRYTGDSTTPRLISTDDFYTAWVWNHRNNWCGVAAWGTQKAQQYHWTNSITSGSAATGYLNFMYGGHKVGSSTNINSGGRLEHITVFGADAPPAVLTGGDVPVSYQKSPGMFFFHFVSDGATELTIPHTLGAVPKYIYTTRPVGGDVRPRASGSLIGASHSLYLNETTAIKADQTGNFYYKAFDANTITYDSFFAQAGECIGLAFTDSPGAVSADTFVSTGTAANAITGIGFQPKWVMLKSLDGTSNHLIFNTDLAAGECAFANALNSSPRTGFGTVTFDADGFTYTGSQGDAGNNWMYVALA